MVRFPALLLALSLSGCSFGPKAIEQTHGRYSRAVQRVEEEEFLKNIVRLRYTEEPRNLNVSAIAAQYELAAGAEARPFFNSQAARVANPSIYSTFTSILPFASLSGSTRPTVSLTPQDDGESVRQFLTPISADTVTFLTQSGWPVGSVMRIWMDRINGVPNWVPASGPTRDKPTDFERFIRIAELLQAAQDRELVSLYSEDRLSEMSGPLPASAVTSSAAVEAATSGYEFRPKDDGKTWSLVKRSKSMVLQENAHAKGSPEMAELASLLNLKPEAGRYEVVVASGVPDPVTVGAPPGTVIRFSPRSTSQALFFLANGVEVPPDHVACGLVKMPPDGANPLEITRGVFRVHTCEGHSHKKPPCAYIGVWYRDRWYYIDDRDQDSKSTLMLMLQLRRLDFKRQEIGRAPTLTLPVGR